VRVADNLASKEHFHEHIRHSNTQRVNEDVAGVGLYCFKCNLDEGEDLVGERTERVVVGVHEVRVRDGHELYLLALDRKTLLRHLKHLLPTLHGARVDDDFAAPEVHVISCRVNVLQRVNRLEKDFFTAAPSIAEGMEECDDLLGFCLFFFLA
jgi:hypothetical protein